MRMMVRQYFGAESEWIDNPPKAWGKANEEGAMIDYTAETGRTVFKGRFVIHSNNWLGATPDGAVGNDGIIEVKCPYGLRKEPFPVPFKSVGEQPNYYAQMQIEMYCSGAQWCDFWQWAPNGHRLEKVERNEVYLKMIIPELQNFYLRFLDCVSNPDLSAPHLADLRPLIDDEDVVGMVQRYRSLVTQEAEIKANKENLLKNIVAATGEKNCVIAGSKLTLVERVGAVSYAKIVKDFLPNLDLNPYRGLPSHYWTLK
jgi:hypothetical protein